jgi:glycosyltransferase involved in cell wall biosynthesis
MIIGGVAPDQDLRLKLESHLPASLPVGSATALFLYGHCFHRRERVESLEVLLDGARFRPDASRMPRRDLYEWLTQAGQDPAGRSYRSGFWLTLPVRAGAAPRTLQLEAEVRLAGGTRLWSPLAQLAVVEPEHAPARPVPPGTIAVCMATFDPDPSLLRAQLDSLRAQTDARWIGLISDGGSDPERFAHVAQLTAGDERFVVSRSEERLGPAANFERALRMVPAGADLVALCDQDDRWYPDKLAALRDALRSALLVYSDQRLVAEDGRVLRESLWDGRRNEYRNLASLLVANTVPGAATLFRRKLLEVALPFPDAPGVPYHDHWLALAALASGEIAYLDRPLFDWVQHPAAASAPRATEPGSRGWRAAYFGGYVMREVQAQTLLLRCDRKLSASKRRALEWFVSASRSPTGFTWLALRPLRRLAGRDETLGGELALLRGIVWRRLIVLAVAGARNPGRRAPDASFPDPPRFEQRRLRRWRAGL